MIDPDALVCMSVSMFVIGVIWMYRIYRTRSHSRKPIRGEVLVPDAMVRLFSDHGITISFEEASLLLDYFFGHDYSLYVRPDGRIMRHDLDACDGTPDDLYSIRNILEFVSDMNEEFIKICERGEDSYNREDLENDWNMISSMIDRYNIIREG